MLTKYFSTFYIFNLISQIIKFLNDISTECFKKGHLKFNLEQNAASAKILNLSFILEKLLGFLLVLKLFS